jgi:serine protease Do
MRFLLIIILLFNATLLQAQERAVPTATSQIQLSFSPVVKKAAPAVVNIYTKRRVQVPSPLARFYNDPVFRHFFGVHPDQRQLTQERIVQSLGSGVIVHPNGIIVSSSHVVAESDEIIAVLNDKREFPARIVALDKETDLAILMLDVEETRLPYLPLAPSKSLEVGDLVLAIGNPFGVGQTVTSGIVSALARGVGELSKKIPKSQAFIQTDAAINPGNSGGALVDMRGSLVGINAAIFSQSGGSHGIGFAVPSEVLSRMLKQFSL